MGRGVSAVPLQAFTKPMQAEAMDGEVVLSAPTGAASVCLTPEAALETAERLKRAAEEARDGEPPSGLAG